MQENAVTIGGAVDAQLLRSVAEQLRTPLAIIARQAELGDLLKNPAAVDTSIIRTQAATALSLLESYLLGLQLLNEQAELLIEPVSVSSLLVEVAHELSGFAKHYNMNLRLNIAGRYEPVMAHPQGLRSALLATGYALIEGYPVDDKILTLSVHRTSQGLVTGIYGSYGQLNSVQWRRALMLRGKVQQPLRALTGGSAAGLFVAQTIMQAMSATLRVGKYRHHYGLAATLQPSHQLQLV